MSNYYQKREAKVNIAMELMARGWTVYGWKEDESDGMTDYYSPAHWGGLAEKNGYILVVDIKNSSKGEEIKKYNSRYVEMSKSDLGKIEALKNMTVEKGCTVGEENNAKNLIEKLQSKYENQNCSRWEVVGRTPAHMGNGKGYQWHIEKDGAIVDQGRGITIYSDLPESYMFDMVTMEFKDSYKTYDSWEYNEESGHNERVEKERTLSNEELKAIKSFKTLILRLERAVTGCNTCGDGTAETEKQGLEQQENETLVKKEFKKVKKVIDLQEVAGREELKVNDIIWRSGSGYLKVLEVREYSYCTVKLMSKARKFAESQSDSKHVNLEKKSYDRSIKTGYTKVYNLVENEEVEIIEKWVKQTVKATPKAEKKEEVKQNTNTTVNDTIENEFDIIEDTHTKTGEKIYIAKIVNRVSKDEFKQLLTDIKALGGYYSKFKGGFIFKEDPTNLLNGSAVEEVATDKEEPEQEKNSIDYNSICDYIVENSSTIIDFNNLSKCEYWNNETYKSMLLEKIKLLQLDKEQFKNVINAIKVHEEYKNYIYLVEVLNGFYEGDNKEKKEESNITIIIDGEGRREKKTYYNWLDATQEFNARIKEYQDRQGEKGYNKTWITIKSNNHESTRKIYINDKVSYTENLRYFLIDTIENDIKFFKDTETGQTYINNISPKYIDQLQEELNNLKVA